MKLTDTLSPVLNHDASAKRKNRNNHRSRLMIDTLEDRTVPAGLADPSTVIDYPNYRVYAASGSVTGDVVQMGEADTPAGASSPPTSAKTPVQIRKAYGLDTILFGGVTGDGAGQTVAIVDAYDDPNILADLTTFSAQYGLPSPTAANFSKVNQSGGSTAGMATNSGWAGEICLDVEWVHAIAPQAKILLVEANDSFSSSLNVAVNYAKSVAGVSVVSMSYGGDEYDGENSADSTFTSLSNHPVTFIASTGDVGGIVEQPSVSPNVLAVGGTSLFASSAGVYSSESAWDGTGGGISAYEAKPSFQNSVTTPSSSMRTVPDVSFDADPNTGVAVCDSFNGGSSPWYQFGGTSFSAPSWAAMIAIANEGRVLSGKTPLNGRADTLPKLYTMSAANFHDVTTGSAGSFNAAAGYDLTTGRGSPRASLIVSALNDGDTPPPPSNVVFVNSKTASYIEPDGDKVTVTFTKPILTAANVGTIVSAAKVGTSGYQLQAINLSGLTAAAGTNITVAAKRTLANSDGLATVGLIDASGIDLGTVTVGGDLGKILAGDTTTKTAGIGALSVASLGRIGTNSQAAGGNLSSAVTGALKTLTVKTDIATGASLNVSGATSADGYLTTLTVSGNLNGSLTLSGKLGTANILGDLKGSVFTSDSVTTLHVAGSLNGQNNFGSIQVLGNATTISIGGSIIGGSGVSFAGAIKVSGNLTTLTVGRDIIGGSATAASQNVSNSGSVAVGGHLGTVTVGGSLIAGSSNGYTSDTLTGTGSIESNTDIGSLTIKGDVIGRSVGAVISAQKQLVPAGKTLLTDLAIGTLSIWGNIENSYIKAGYDWNGIATNGSAQIGTVNLRGDWRQSSLLAGTDMTRQAIVNRANANALSKVSLITIGGQMIGDTSASVSYGITAQSIVAMKIAGQSLGLLKGEHNDNLSIGFYGNMKVIEL
ncbi:S53 family peptidase [Zavarzinella formosa]|uniref:S53 family peptidase n=1 Tax=Zavarzinella formosa TaxID=360055 RepID=UPI0002DFC1A1|nr:S53 family peptidase [Zavarzinella formosa]